MEVTDKNRSEEDSGGGKKTRWEKGKPPKGKRSEDFIESPGMDSFSQSRIFSVLESLLFSSDKPLGLAAFKQVFENTSLGSSGIRKALEELKVSYLNSSRGVSLEEIGGGWQLRTKPENREFLKRLNRSRPFRLSGPALEVLSIIAYKQPIVKSEVDRVRGVESGHLMRSLMEKKLVSFQGKSELPGKPFQYGTTTRFLEIFGLKNIKELPGLEEMDQLLPEGMGDVKEDERENKKLIPVAGKMSGLKHSGLLDEKELTAIGETLKGIKTTPEKFPEGENPEEGGNGED